MKKFCLVLFALGLFACSEDSDSNLTNVIDEGKQALGAGKGCLLENAITQTKICYTTDVAMTESACIAGEIDPKAESALVESCPADPVHTCNVIRNGVTTTYKYYGEIYKLMSEETLCQGSEE